MRDLIFKNLTCRNKSRKILLAKETISEEGILTRIQKHLIYDVHEISNEVTPDKKAKNELFILKEKNTKLKTETFFIKMKSSMCANSNNKAFIINFLHSLKIDLSPNHT
ncbi:hypothetical protein HQ550_04665 [bacterium]|nr:hypothetical protein [bacterium]